jgi:hypothetical protein
MTGRPRSPGELFLALRVAAVATAAPLLSRLSLARLERVIEPRRTRSRSRPLADVAGTVDWVLGAVPLVQRHCLTRGITMYYFLRREGADVALTFGMGATDGEFPGHCWLVKDGEPYLEAKDPRPLFKEMYQIPRAA